LFFDTLHRKSIFHLVYKNEETFTAVVDIFLGMKEQDLPYLMLEDEQGKTPLDLVIAEKK
jgi:hypothetical protein